jgi:hypothetical protein
VDDERIGPAVPDPDRLVNEVVGLRRLLGDGVYGMLQDLPLRPRHNRRVDRLPDLLEACRTPGLCSARGAGPRAS